MLLGMLSIEPRARRLGKHTLNKQPLASRLQTQGASGGPDLKHTGCCAAKIPAPAASSPTDRLKRAWQRSAPRIGNFQTPRCPPPAQLCRETSQFPGIPPKQVKPPATNRSNPGNNRRNRSDPTLETDQIPSKSESGQIPRNPVKFPPISRN